MGRRTTVPVRDAAQERIRRPGRSRLVVAAALLASISAPVALSVGHAQATSVQTLRQEAQRILAEINANGDRISVLDEQINQAHIRLDALHVEIRRTSLQIASAQRTIGSLHGAVVSRAAALYRGAGGATDLGPQSASTVQAQGAMQMYTQAAAAQDQLRIDQYRNARDARTRAKAKLDAAEKSQRQQLDSLQAQQRQILHLSSREQALYNQTNSQLRQAIANEEARAAAAARAAANRARAAADAAAAARRTTGTTDTGTGTGPTNPGPPPSAGAATAVYWAQQELGKPYLMDAAGPGSFDCSGLTMFAWAHAGVSMPHSAASEYYMFPHVPLSQAQPGDLVAFGSPIHHIGIVVGGGSMIEAPHSGAFVRYANYLSRSDIVGVARP